MTVSSTQSRKDYAGDGATTQFTVPYFFIENADIVATLRSTGGTETTWTEGTEYTLTGAGTPSGGTLTAVSTGTDYTPQSGETLVIRRREQFTQPSDFAVAGALPSETIEEGYDRAVMLAQQLSEDLGRTARLAETSPTTSMLVMPEPEADKVLVWNSTGDNLTNGPTTGQITQASTKADQAAASATAAAASASSASTSETNAAASASAASTSASNASTSETNAATSATNAVVNAAGFRFDFDNSTTMADPGTGDVRFNNATIASVTALAFDATSADTGNPDISALILTWDDSTNTALRGTLTFRKVGTPGTFVTFSITGAVVDNTGWLQVPVAHVGSNGTISNTDNLIVHFTRTGDKGADGAGSGDVVGPASATDNALARYNTTTGKLVQDSKVIVDDDGNMSGNGAKLNAQTGTTYTLTGADNGKVVTLDNAAAITLTLPETATESIAQGFQCALIAKGAGQVTVAKEGTDTILSKDSNLKLSAQGSVATVIKLTAGSPNAWFLGGDLAA